MGATVSITDIYMNALSSLSDKEKLDLISKLTNSIIKKKKKKKVKDIHVFDCFHTDWGGDRTPEEIAEDLRKSRVFKREVPTW